MLRRVAFFLVICLLLPCFSFAETAVTSFYPLWLFTLRLTEGIDEVSVVNLADSDVGCLHDYQLQTSDMKTLSGADVFLVNGAGMEAFLPEITAAFPDLPVIVASDGIPLLYDLDAEAVGEAEQEVNAHLWLDASRAALMVDRLADGLCAVWPSHREAIRRNQEDYSARLHALDETLRSGLRDLPRREIVTFHEAFPYFAEAYGLDVVAVVNREPGETLTPAQMARLRQVLLDLNCPPLFVEPQYEDLSARTLSAETGSPVYVLDPVVTGPSDAPADYYETVMLQNMATLRKALGGE